MRARGLVIALFACVPGSDLSPSYVDAPLLVAVKADPPEGLPGAPVTLTAIVAAPGGTPADARLSWAFCLRPRAPADTTPVAAACASEGPWIAPITGTGRVVASAIPADACETVGPEVPPGGASNVPQRAPDPDSTGGYYVTVGVQIDDPPVRESDYARLRVRCRRPDLSADIARELGMRDRPNRNPSLTGVALRRGSSTLALPAEGASTPPPVAHRGEALTLVVTWSDDSAETYVRPDVTGTRVETGRESLEVSWYTDGGRFLRSRTAPAGDGRSENGVTVDARARPRSTFWVVLRDGRGGVDATSVTLAVE